jgi:hypothetical protein
MSSTYLSVFLIVVLLFFIQLPLEPLLPLVPLQVLPLVPLLPELLPLELLAEQVLQLQEPPLSACVEGS